MNEYRVKFKSKVEIWTISPKVKEDYIKRLKSRGGCIKKINSKVKKS